MYSDVIGKTVPEALSLLKDKGITKIRFYCIDGRHAIITADYRQDRLNVDGCIRHGVPIITNIVGVG